MSELNNFEALQIGIASPEKILSWSRGEVTKSETINYRTQKPEKDGLFCEKIFGPMHDYECNCGKYKRIRYKGTICDKCGVEVTKASVRRERMGHIALASPVTHIWYYKGMPSRIGLVLDMPAKDLDQVIYFMNYVVLDPGTAPFEKKQIITHKQMLDAQDEFGAKSFKCGMGAEAIKQLLSEVDLDKESAELKEILTSATGQKRAHAVKRLEIIEAFRSSKNDPTWMVLDVLPVIPPDVRPMVQLDGGRYASSDLNDLYRRVINRNNRLKKLVELNSPDIIIRNEKRMLQEAVDALIDNGRRGKAITGAGSRDLKSLSAMLRGKQGRFRQNLLGKRVDYSGRSVIVVGPNLKLYQCGLPKEMALELFKPFVMKKLVDYAKAANIKSAKKIVERANPVVWDILEEVIKDHPVLLNRAPTLHRLGIQAFEPVLVEGRAIKLHPLVCPAFNADFDGDQMAVHVPLSIEAQTEARFLMLSANNILKLSDGKPIVTPAQDMVMGSYYLTIIKENGLGEGRFFKSEDEAIMAYQLKQIELQSRINVRVTKEIDGTKETKILRDGIYETLPDGTKVERRLPGGTTVGRIIFNQSIPQDLHFIPRETRQQKLDLEINFVVDKKGLSRIVDNCYTYKGATSTAVVLDNIKAMGFKYSTIAGITASVFDMHIPKEKAAIIKQAEEDVIDTEKNYMYGYITEDERYKTVLNIWNAATDNVKDKLKDTLETFNPIWMMANSGARGSMNQIKQLSGMRGLMSNPSGRTIELPVKANFREGLSVLEYFISSHGGRKGLADTALKTANSGYLTRRLVDISHDVIVREEDCNDTRGFAIGDLLSAKGDIIETIDKRVQGRFVINDVVNPATGEVIVPADTMVSLEQAKAIKAAGITSVNIRSILTCNCKHGVCAKCYGKNMASGAPVKIGEVVGVIAAQSIGEPGTQLTMRTFHTGGVATSEDITQGLPRVEELFEARNPKGEAIISEIAGTVAVLEQNKKREIIVTSRDGLDKKSYSIPFISKLAVADGDSVEPGSPLTLGSINPTDMLRIRGVRGVQEYLIREVRLAYHLSGVEIADKHIEVIVRQMLRRVRIEHPGDTGMLPGALVDIFTCEEENQKALEEGGRPAVAKRTLLGITKAALATNSFLSAASFQETAKVLTDAAIQGKVDPLIGLKENIIIGKLIPAGTGLKQYRNVKTTPVKTDDAMYDSSLDDERFFMPDDDEIDT